MSSEIVLFKKEGHFLSTEKNIGKIVLNRPDALNALNLDMLEGIDKALDVAEQDKEVRAVIITADGQKAFSVGADLKFVNTADPETVQKFLKRGQELFRRVENFPKPIIAAINGLCLGGGLELSLACDIRIAQEEAKLGAPEVAIGLIPAWGGTTRLPRIIGLGRAKELILTGAHIPAKDAEKIGLVNKVVPYDELQSTAVFIAAQIAGNAPLALKEAKIIANLSHDVPLEEGNAKEYEAVAKLAESKDLKEGITAVFEKRKARFTGE